MTYERRGSFTAGTSRFVSMDIEGTFTTGILMLVSMPVDVKGGIVVVMPPVFSANFLHLN